MSAPVPDARRFLEEPLGQLILAFVAGAVVGALALFAAKKLLGIDPPPPELVESIAKSEWARKWAEKFCGGTGKEREECIERLTRLIAESLAERIATLSTLETGL